MKNLLRVGALLLALSPLGGCTQLVNDVNGVVDWIDAPKTQQAFTSLEHGAQAFACGVSAAASLAGAVEQEVNAGQAIVGKDQMVYGASATVCQFLGGTATPLVAVVP